MKSEGKEAEDPYIYYQRGFKDFKIASYGYRLLSLPAINLSELLTRASSLYNLYTSIPKIPQVQLRYGLV